MFWKMRVRNGVESGVSGRREKGGGDRDRERADKTEARIKRCGERGV